MRIEYEIPDLSDLLAPVSLPEVARVRHEMPAAPPIGDIRAAVHAELQRVDAGSTIRPGQRIAVGVGSRGIARLPEIVAALVAELRDLGARPFIIPTMGSHGGATADGQRGVLEHLGVTAERVGAPIEAQMETEEIGRAPDGTAVRIDRLALHSDGIVFVGRVKPHTAFRGTYESGLAKMIAIGLGKQAGAAACHAQGFGEMARLVPALTEVAIVGAPIRFGLAVIENAYDQPYKLRIVPARRILEEEPALLEEARRAMPRLPFEAIDVLIIDELGKDISGDGADPNISGRYGTPFASGGPRVGKQVVLDLTDATDGNANGIGLADITTVRAARKMSFARTYPNALTSTVIQCVALPMVLPSDRHAIAAAVLTCNAVGRPVRVVRIKNTLHIGEYWVSSGLLDEVRSDSRQRVLGDPAPFAFDAAGNLEV